MEGKVKDSKSEPKDPDEAEAYVYTMGISSRRTVYHMPMVMHDVVALTDRDDVRTVLSIEVPWEYVGGMVVAMVHHGVAMDDVVTSCEPPDFMPMGRQAREGHVFVRTEVDGGRVPMDLVRAMLATVDLLDREEGR